MIAFDRGPEPRALLDERRGAQARAILAWAESRDVEMDGYRVAARHLWDLQHRKCAWCERVPGWENQPVEHYRPKGGAIDGDAVTRERKSHDQDHYWWLAWTWENLLFACARCNGPATKGNWFPLAPGAARARAPSRDHHLSLPAESMAIADERPLLLDPGAEDPMLSIVWTPLDEAVADWADIAWRPRHTNGRGRATIAILALDKDHAADVSDDIRVHVTPKVKRISAAIGVRDQAALDAAFDELEKLFARTQPFLAARFDAWSWFRSQPSLAGLSEMSARTIARPSRTPVPLPPLAPRPDPPEMAGLSARLVLRLRAGSFANIDDAVASLTAEKPFDEMTLARLLSYKTPGYVAGALKLKDDLLSQLTTQERTLEARAAAAACGVQEMKAVRMLECLVEAGVLARTGSGASARYSRK